MQLECKNREIEAKSRELNSKTEELEAKSHELIQERLKINEHLNKLITRPVMADKSIETECTVRSKTSVT